MRPLDPRNPSPQAHAAAERVDRAFAATRPAEPSSLLLDSLWAQAAAELDRIDAARRAGVSTSVMPIGDRPTRRRLKTSLILAQAAAILIGAMILLHRRGSEPVGGAHSLHPTALAKSVPPAMVEVAADSILVFRIDGRNDARVERLDQAPMFPMMAEHTQHDLFNDLESQASFPAVAENSARSFFDATEGNATP